MQKICRVAERKRQVCGCLVRHRSGHGKNGRRDLYSYDDIRAGNRRCLCHKIQSRPYCGVFGNGQRQVHPQPFLGRDHCPVQDESACVRQMRVIRLHEDRES